MSLKQAFLLDSLFIENVDDLKKNSFHETSKQSFHSDSIAENISVIPRPCVHENENPNLFIDLEKISPEHMSVLIDQGFFRRGKTVMKPISSQACCARYGLRTELAKFKLSRSMKSSLRPMKKYAMVGEPASLTSEGDNSENFALPELSREQLLDITQKELEEFLRIASKEKSKSSKNDAAKGLEAELEAIKNGEKHKIEVRLVALDSSEFKATYDESFDIFCKWNRGVHASTNEAWCTKEFFDKSFTISAMENVHDKNNKLGAMGTFHLQFWVDEVLKGVAEIDILTRYVCGNLNWYDPDYRVLSMGKFMILSTMALAYKISKVRPEMKYFCGGIIEPNRPRQNYKCYFSTEMLCDRTRKWVPIDEAVKTIYEAQGKYAVFLPNEPMKLPDIFSIPCEFNEEIQSFGIVRRLLEEETEWEEKLRTYANCARLLVKEMIVKIK